MLFLDGAYTFYGNRPIFHRARRPNHEELNQLLDALSRRIGRLLQRRIPPVDETPSNQLPAQVAGLSAHAATVCEAHQRGRLERLCRYITRPPTR